MDELTKLLIEKIDKLDDKVDNMNLSVSTKLSQYNASLEEHMRRTDIAEAKLKIVDDFVNSSKAVIKAMKWLGIPTMVVSGIIYGLNKM